MDISNFNTNVFYKFKEEYGLLTVGNKDKFNAMTVGWGGFGTLWGKSVVTIYVRESRYTHEFLEKEDYFTVSFLSCIYSNELVRIFGEKSGRDTDKIKESQFEVEERPHGITFKQAECTLVCKKLFKQHLEINNIPKEIVEQFYTGEDDAPHDMYIGEVVEYLYHADIKKKKWNWNWIFKSGKGNASNSSRWEVCYDRNTNKYSAEVCFSGRGGARQDLYEITKEIYDQVGTFENDDYISERLIKNKGRHLYENVNEIFGPPYKTVIDDNYKKICPWADIPEEENSDSDS